MTTEAIEAMFARRDAAFARHDAAALTADFADDCVVEGPVAGTHVGREAVRRVYQDFFSAFRDYRIHTDELLVFGNRIVQVFTSGGTDTGGFLGLPPTGKQFSASGVFVFTLNDEGQIVRERRIYDFNRLLLQLAGDAQPVTEGSQRYRDTLEGARLEQEMKIAAEIQGALFPRHRYSGAGFQVLAASVPSRTIGGDFVHYVTLRDGAFAFALGDVAGKGPAAALLAAMLLGVLEGHAESDAAPAATLARANKAFVRRTIEARFATMLYGVLAPGGALTYSNAGHPPPLLIGAHGLRRLDTGGSILGVFPHATFEEETLQLEPGDVLVAFSDGVTEAENGTGEEFGEARLASTALAHRNAGPEALLDRLLDAVRQFSAGEAQADDRTLLVLRYLGT